MGGLGGLCRMHTSRLIHMMQTIRKGSQDRNLAGAAQSRCLAVASRQTIPFRGDLMKTRYSIAPLAILVAAITLHAIGAAAAQSRSASLLGDFGMSRAARTVKPTPPAAANQEPEQPTIDLSSAIQQPGETFVSVSDFHAAISQPVSQVGFMERFGGVGSSTCCDTGCCDDACCDSGCCDSPCCDSGCCDTCCDCAPCCPWWSHRTNVFGEFLYLTAADADVTHAQQQDGTGGAGTVPFGIIGRVDPDWEPGFRVGGAKCLNNCASIFVAYTHYESNAVHVLNPPVIPGGGGAVGSYLHHPAAAVTASTAPASLFYEIDFQLADVGVRGIRRACNRYAINWSLGGRFGHLEQNLGQLISFSGGGGGQINTRTNVDFDGAGLRFGLDGERRFGQRGFSIYANVNVSPMLGTVQADYTMQNVTTSVLLAQSIWKDDRFVTILDYEAGFAWTSCNGKWRLSSGFNAAHWFNAVTTDSFISGVQNNNYEDIAGALSFSGAVARVERRF